MVKAAMVVKLDQVLELELVQEHCCAPDAGIQCSFLGASEYIYIVTHYVVVIPVLTFSGPPGTCALCA